MAGHCQDCDGCCRVFEVKDIGKAFGEPCKYLGRTAIGPGCTIYESRPQACMNYVCLWLDSQRRQGVERMPEALRPDVCKVVMGWPWGEDRDTLYVYPYPGHEGAWRYPPVSDHLRMILRRGGKIVVVAGDKRMILKDDLAIMGTEDEFENMLR